MTQRAFGVTATATVVLAALACGDAGQAPATTESPPAATAGGDGAAAPGETAAATEKVSAPDGVKEATARILGAFAAFNGGDLDGALEPMSFELEYNVVGGERIKGKGHVRKAWQELRESFPDLKRHVRRVIHTDETIAVEYVVTGTHKGTPFAGFEASDKVVGYDALMIFHSTGKEVTAITLYEDRLTPLLQLGYEKGEAPPKAPPPVDKPLIDEGDAMDRSMVKFVKDWYAAMGPDWSRDCDKTFCTDDAAFYIAPTGAAHVKQMDRASYLDILVEGGKKAHVSDVWVEPASDYFVTFTTWKSMPRSMSLAIPGEGPIDVKVAQVLKLRDGKIAEITTYYNRRAEAAAK